MVKLESIESLRSTSEEPLPSASVMNRGNSLAYDSGLVVEVLWRIADYDPHPIGSLYRDIEIILLQDEPRDNGEALSEGGRCMGALEPLHYRDLDGGYFKCLQTVNQSPHSIEGCISKKTSAAAPWNRWSSRRTVR